MKGLKMANVIYNGKIVGTLLIDPQGTNMGVQWNDSVSSEEQTAAWHKFMDAHPTGSKIDNVDILLS